MLPVPCSACKSTLIPVQRWRRFDDGTEHLEARCSACDQFIQYVKQTPENLREAPAKPTFWPQQGGFW